MDNPLLTGPTVRYLGLRRVVRCFGALIFAVMPVFFTSGCATIHREQTAFPYAWDPGVEVHFPGAMPAEEAKAEADTNGKGKEKTKSRATHSRVVTAPDMPMPPVKRVVRGAAAVAVFAYDQLGLQWVSRPLKGVPEYDETKYTLIPGSYAFKYDTNGFRPVFGAVHLYPVFTDRAKDFIRHGSIALTPGPMGEPSVLTDADLERARNGDVVTKLVFMADSRAVRDRLDDIDESLREMQRVRTSLDEQLSYWNRKLADRRINASYSSDFGWGIDVPSWDLALLQSLVGPERYHWHRFSEAEDEVRTYESKIAEFKVALRNLHEERAALQKIMQSIDVLDRSNDLLVLAPNMVRPYHDPVDEVHSFRGVDAWRDFYRGKIMHDADDWVGPWGKVHFPYWYSSLVNANLLPGLRPVAAPRMALTKPIGEVMMVLQIGQRRLPELGGHSWVANP